jgi:nucleoside-diphosphate kinase
MAGNTTLTIIKPDAFKVRAARVLHMTDRQAGAFYEVHRERPFYKSLVTFMTSGPCMPIVLQRANAVAELRTAIGATDPAEAATGTVRKLFAESKERNAIHASDSDDNAHREAQFFFSETELLNV